MNRQPKIAADIADAFIAECDSVGAYLSVHVTRERLIELALEKMKSSPVEVEPGGDLVEAYLEKYPALRRLLDATIAQAYDADAAVELEVAVGQLYDSCSTCEECQYLSVEVEFSTMAAYRKFETWWIDEADRDSDPALSLLHVYAHRKL